MIILTITLLMALATAAIVYFVDQVPTLIEGTQIASKLSVGTR